jgi:hypothetical protein
MADPFNPAIWLASFEKVGGAYAAAGERLYLWIIPGDLDFDDLSKARTLVVELTSEQRAQAVGHLHATALVES